MLFLSYCCVVSTSHAINVVYGIARPPPPPPHGVVIRPAQNNPSGPRGDLIYMRSNHLMKQGPRTLVSAHRASSFYLSPFVTHSRVYDMHRASLPVSFVTLYSSIIIIIIIIIIFLLERSFFFFFLLLSSSSFLFGLSCPHSCYYSMRKTNASAGNSIRFEKKKQKSKKDILQRRQIKGLSRMGIGIV